MAKTVKEVLAMGKNVQMVDLRFIDLPGTWQHFSIPASTMDESLFEEGIGFDGSSIRGFKTIDESDMLLFLDPQTAFVDPTLEVPTLVIICDVYDPITSQPYERDPRGAQKPNSLSSMRCAMVGARIPVSIMWIVVRAGGILVRN
jgi:glutamine synthetase